MRYGSSVNGDLLNIGMYIYTQNKIVEILHTLQ